MKLFRTIAKSFGKFLTRLGNDLVKWGEREPKVIKKIKEIEISKWYNVEAYISIVESGNKDFSPADAGYILLNVDEANLSNASDVLKKMPVQDIKAILKIPKNRIVYEVHHGISNSQEGYFYLDVNGEKIRVKAFQNIKEWLDVFKK
jgi:hypothetical protein